MEITSNFPQAVKPNMNIMFYGVRTFGNASILHQEGSGLVTLRGLCARGYCRARFRVFFSANVKADTSSSISDVTLLSTAIAQNGEPIEASTMTVTVGDTTSAYNISTEILVDVPAGCCSTLSVKNITDNIVLNYDNANLIVERVA